MVHQDAHQLKLIIVSQERQLLEVMTDSVTLPGSEGELTVLPGHLPIFTRLVSGELIYRSKDSEHSVAISRGFLDVTPDGTVMVIVDVATEARSISIERAERAIQKAKETMEKSQDQRELLFAEASLKQALLEIKVAQKTKKSKL